MFTAGINYNCTNLLPIVSYSIICKYGAGTVMDRLIDCILLLHIHSCATYPTCRPVVHMRTRTK